MVSQYGDGRDPSIAIACPFCMAHPGQACRRPDGTPYGSDAVQSSWLIHKARQRAWERDRVS
jgi:hypothetical protein